MACCLGTVVETVPEVHQVVAGVVVAWENVVALVADGVVSVAAGLVVPWMGVDPCCPVVVVGVPCWKVVADPCCLVAGGVETGWAVPLTVEVPY